jgi:hypothetical protein
MAPRRMSKKGQVFSQLGSLATGVATLAIVLTVAFLVMSEGKDQAAEIEGLDFTNTTECHQSITCNATEELQNATGDIPGWVPLVIIASIGAILLGLVSLFRRR